MPYVRKATPETLANAAARCREPAEVLLRLLHHAHVVITDGAKSYRLARATAGKGVVPLG